MHQLSIFQHLIGANVDGVSVFQVVETQPALPPHSNFETLSYLLTINSGLCRESRQEGYKDNYNNRIIIVT